MTDPAETLPEGETLIARWTPSFWVFAQWYGVVGLVTALILGGFAPQLGLIAQAAISVLLVLVSGFVFDDYTVWLERRHDVWLLTDRQLHYINRADAMAATALPLDRITAIRWSGWWALILRLYDGRSLSLSYLPRLRKVKSAILAAQRGVP